MIVNYNGQYFGEWDKSLQELADFSGLPVSGFSWDSTDWNRVYSVKVNEERDRRINGGFIFESLLYQSDVTSRENISNAALMAYMALMNGAADNDYTWADGSTNFFWITTNNTRVNMDAKKVVELGKRAAAWKTANIYAASDLKQMTLIPQDFASNQYWPV